MYASCLKFTGTPGEAGWTQIHDFTASGEKASYGRLICLISAGGMGQGLDEISFGREILARVHEQYFGGSQDRGVVASIKSVLTKIEREFASSAQLDIGLVVWRDGVLYSGCIGGAQTFLIREGRWYDLFAPGGHVVGGKLIADDQVVLGSGNFFKHVSKGSLAAALSSSGATEARLSSLIHIGSNSARNAVAVFRVNTVADKPPDVDEPEIAPVDLPRPTPVRIRLVGLIDRLIALLPKDTLRLSRTDSEYKERIGKKKTVLLGSAVLVVILVLSLSGYKLSRERATQETKTNGIKTIEHLMESARQSAKTNKEEAETLYLRAQEEYAKLVSSVSDAETVSLGDKLSDLKNTLLGVYPRQISTVLAFSLVSDSFKAKQVVFDEGLLYVLSDDTKELIQVQSDGKAVKRTTLPHSGNVISLAAYSGSVYVFDRNAIYTQEGKKIYTTDAFDIDAAAIFAGNAYVVDVAKTMIYRVRGSLGRFTLAENWLGGSDDHSLNGVVDMAIDGAIWILGTSGDVTKYSLGRKDIFPASNVKRFVASSSSIFVSEETKYLYLLDRTNKAVFVFDKGGGHVGSYTADDFSDGIDLIVSEQDGLGFVLTQTKLLSFPLLDL